jgi:polyisoprenoid-binding protein YceI
MKLVARTLLLLTVAILLLPAPGLADATRMRIDKNHSSVTFRVPILGGLSTVTGKFMDWEVELDYDPDSPSASAVHATIQVASIDTGIEQRDGHLRTADFFDADTHATIEFTSQHLDLESEGGFAHGSLTMRGHSKPIELKIEVTGRDGSSIGFKATTVLDRRDFGIDWQHSSVPGFVSNDITVELFILASTPSEE